MTVKEFNEAVKRACDMINNGMTLQDAFHAMLIPESKQDWTPNDGEIFFYIGVVHGYWEDCKDYYKAKSTLGIYRTAEEAEAMLEKLQKVVRGDK